MIINAFELSVIIALSALVGCAIGCGLGLIYIASMFMRN